MTAPASVKVCSACRQEKPLGEFSRYGPTRPYLRGQCNVCTNAYRRRLRAERNAREGARSPSLAIPCPVDGVPYREHPRCAECSISTGSDHIETTLYQGGLCWDCYARKTGVRI